MQNEIEVNLSAIDGNIHIHLDGDYESVLKNIGLNSGVIVHGTNLEAKQSLENMRDFVFSPTSGLIGINELDIVGGFGVFPNPTFDGQVELKVKVDENLNFDISVINTLGQDINGISHELNSKVTEKVIIKNNIFLVIFIFIKYLSYFIFKSVIVK